MTPNPCHDMPKPYPRSKPSHGVAGRVELDPSRAETRLLPTGTLACAAPQMCNIDRITRAE
jgi:hypothetical protein